MGTQLAIEHMRRDKGGKGGVIINTASFVGTYVGCNSSFCVGPLAYVGCNSSTSVGMLADVGYNTSSRVGTVGVC